MPEPLSLLPLALAARGGTLDDIETQQWVAAGFTLLARSAALVRCLARGRSAILLPPGGAFLTALAASDGRGAVLINPLASRPEILRQLQDAGAVAVFTNALLAALLPAHVARVLLDRAPREAVVVVDGVTTPVDLGAHFGLSLSGSIDVDGSDEEAVIVYTSAMAGTPLGATLTHRNLLANLRGSNDALGDTADDHCLAALPFAHLFGLIVAAAAPLLQGARVTTMDRFHPLRAIELLQQRGITRFMGVPSMFESMLTTLARRGDGKLHRHMLRLCFSGGAVVPEQLQDRWFDATGVELRQGYGLTEAGPACTLARADQPNRRGAMGTAIAGTDVTIRCPFDSLPLDDEMEGEICVRGPHVFRGYVSGGDDGLQVRNGWLHTGDLGVRHADGSLAFRGLLKPMFTRNGFNIYPREIEEVFSRMPGVHCVRAFAISDPVREHSVAVRVEGAVTEPMLRQWAQQELAAYKVPSVYEVVVR
jgi:long-chain acyl-CoA synthetase